MLPEELPRVALASGWAIDLTQRALALHPPRPNTLTHTHIQKRRNPPPCPPPHIHTQTHTPPIQPLKALYGQGFLSRAHRVISPMQLRCFKSAFSGRRSMGVMRESAGWTAPLLNGMGSPPTRQESGQMDRWMDTPHLREERECVCGGVGCITTGRKCVCLSY